MQLEYIVKETDNYTDINEVLNTKFNICFYYGGD